MGGSSGSARATAGRRPTSLPTSKRLPLPRTDAATPPRLPFTAAERRILDRLRSPAAVQRWLNALPYNNEKGGETLRSFRGVVRLGTAHCLEAALAAAVMGIGRAVARSGAPRAEARVRHAACARAQLLRSVHRLHRPCESVHRGR